MSNTDLTVDIDNITLNIRTLVLIKTPNGYIFEKSPNDYYFVVGGRIKINENSIQAAKRELLEELNLKVNEIKLKAIIENFFFLDGIRETHELNFVFSTKISTNIQLPEDFYIFNKAELNSKDIRPKVIKDVIRQDNQDILHLINNEKNHLKFSD